MLEGIGLIRPMGPIGLCDVKVLLWSCLTNRPTVQSVETASTCRISNCLV